MEKTMVQETLTPATMKRGGAYNWKNQPDRLIYLRRFNGWHQFKKIGDPREVWCEVRDEDLHMLEETAEPEPEWPNAVAAAFGGLVQTPQG
jgi:hypothetical protein